MFRTTVKVVSPLMTSNKVLCALQFAYESEPLATNAKTLRRLILQAPEDSIILAPELCLSGYRYDSMHEAALFSSTFLPKMYELSSRKTIGLTLITQEEEHFFNTFMLFHKGECVYTQHKAHLFALGNEEKYFQAGQKEAIRVIDIEGIKIAVLICFELRFSELWEQI